MIGKGAAAETRPIDRPIGWLDAWNRPEAVSLMRAARKKARVRWLVTTLTPLTLGVTAGLALRGLWRFDLESGAVLGVLVAAVLQLWALPPLIARHMRPWEGVVMKLDEVRLPKRALSSGFYSAVHAARDKADIRERYVTEYSVVCKTGTGRRRAIRFLDDSERFGYFRAGDRVRFCPALGTFEKRGREGDDAVYCPLCGARSSLGHARCDGCDLPFFPGDPEELTPPDA